MGVDVGKDDMGVVAKLRQTVDECDLRGYQTLFAVNNQGRTVSLISSQ